MLHYGKKVYFEVLLFLVIWCSSHASATATYEQRRPKQAERKDQASDAYKWLPCTWK